MNIKDFMEVINYRITEGSDFGWTCFGEHAFTLSSWNGEDDGWSFNMVFDTRDQTVYTVEVCDYQRKRAYRYFKPQFRDAYMSYGKANQGNEDYLNQAWDDIKFTDLEVEEDWIEKARAIVAGSDYSTDVSVPLNLDDEELFTLMKMAHERDITFNQLCREAIQAVIDREKETAGNLEV